MKKIVVTGATSMIGNALICSALQDAAMQKIYAVIRPGTKRLERLPDDSRITVVACDIGNYEDLPELISDTCDIFYHLAWPRTATYDEDYEDILFKCENIQTVMKAVHAAAIMGCAKFVGAGSQSEYGVDHVGRLSPETPCKPVRADGIIHLAAGELARILCEKAGMSCIWMRIFSIYGKYDRPNSMVRSTIAKLKSGEHCSFTQSEQNWDFLAAEDAGRAFYLVGKKACGNHVYCLGSGERKTLREYIEIIRDEVAPNAELGFGELPYPPNPVMDLCADITKLQQDTGWYPQIGFKEGVQMLRSADENE